MTFLVENPKKSVMFFLVAFTYSLLHCSEWSPGGTAWDRGKWKVEIGALHGRAILFYKQVCF